MLNAYIRYRAERMCGGETDTRGFWAWWKGDRLARKLLSASEAGDFRLQEFIRQRYAWSRRFVNDALPPRRVDGEFGLCRPTGDPEFQFAFHLETSDGPIIVRVPAQNARFIVFALQGFLNLPQRYWVATAPPSRAEVDALGKPPSPKGKMINLAGGPDENRVGEVVAVEGSDHPDLPIRIAFNGPRERLCVAIDEDSAKRLVAFTHTYLRRTTPI